MTDIKNKLQRFYEIKDLDEETVKFISQFEKNGEYNLDEGDGLSSMDFDVMCDVHVHGKYHVCLPLLKYHSVGHKKVYNQFVHCFIAFTKDEFRFRGIMGAYDGLKCFYDLDLRVLSIFLGLWIIYYYYEFYKLERIGNGYDED